MTWMRVPSAISANTASGLEFSPQMSPDIGPNSRLERAEGVAVAAHVDEPLADRRHDLLVLADDACRPGRNRSAC